MTMDAAQNPDLKVRPFLERDRDDVVNLWVRCGLVVPWNHPDRDIDRKLAVQREGFLVGEVEGRVAASVMAGYEGHRGWVNYLAVDPDLRGRGYGRVMMQHAERHLEEMGAPKVQLQVRATNRGVIEFYRRIGYEPYEVVDMGKRIVPDPPYDPSRERGGS